MGGLADLKGWVGLALQVCYFIDSLRLWCVTPAMAMAMAMAVVKVSSMPQCLIEHANLQR